MKKFFTFIFALMLTLTVNAQIATENQKFLDNTYVTIHGGVSTPLNFNEVFPVNSIAGVSLGKWFTPVYGAEVEGSAWFGSHASYGLNDRVNFTRTVKEDGSVGMSYNAIRGMYLGTNGLVNLTNLFKGYTGVPRVFELTAVAGLGWIHGFRPNLEDKYNNHLGAKTGLNFDINFGKTKAHTFSIRPAVLWNLSEPGNSYGNLAFNSKGTQLYLGVGYTYRFKTSNGTHNFKTYDVGTLFNELDRLNAELDRKSNEVVREVIREVQVPAVVNNEVVVFFAKGSYELTNEAKKALNKVHGVVNVYGFASPEGTKDFNTRLSNMRAQVVADYLVNLPNNITINACEGKGVQGDTSGRVTIVQVGK